ncbi:MAG: hypothetical protein K6G89_04500 [Clostridia bacterium]|nr:hypothetical protein [Clostridia bacterium]
MGRNNKNRQNNNKQNQNKRIFILIGILVLTAVVAFCVIKLLPLNIELPADILLPVSTDARGGDRTPGQTAKQNETATPGQSGSSTPGQSSADDGIKEDGSYYDRDSVARYIAKFGKLPSNYITKKQAQALGWEGGSVEKYATGKAIGGDYFSDFDEKLPDPPDMDYYECDIDTNGGKARGAKRIIYGANGRIFYTEDHYETYDEFVNGSWVDYP